MVKTRYLQVVVLVTEIECSPASFLPRLRIQRGEARVEWLLTVGDMDSSTSGSTTDQPQPPDSVVSG
jgi:hypothetical protein